MAFKAGGIDDLNAEINVTPLVDVMLVLLIIFMITSPLATPPPLPTGVELELPQGKQIEMNDPAGKLVLTIGKGNKLLLGGTPLKWQELEAKLKNNEKVKREGALWIEADKDLPYGVVVTAMSVAKSAGVPKVMMLTAKSDNLQLPDLDRGAPAGTQNKPPGGASK
jgi:biopolymer transport protein TolR